jgi:hypothetical protein
MFDPSYIYDEFPTKYDLYYFKWYYYVKRGVDISESISSYIEAGSVDIQYVEKFFYYLLISIHRSYGWSVNCDYTINTDHFILTSNQDAVPPYVITLDYRKRSFSLCIDHVYNHATNAFIRYSINQNGPSQPKLNMVTEQSVNLNLNQDDIDHTNLNQDHDNDHIFQPNLNNQDTYSVD